MPVFALPCYVQWYLCPPLPPDGVLSIVMSMSVCLSVHLRNSKTTRPNLPNFCRRCMWSWLGPPLARLRHTSGLCTTSCFHVIALWYVICISKQQENMTRITAEIPTKFCSTIKTVNCPPGANSAILRSLVYLWKLSYCTLYALS